MHQIVPRCSIGRAECTSRSDAALKLTATPPKTARRAPQSAEGVVEPEHESEARE